MRKHSIRALIEDSSGIVGAVIGPATIGTGPLSPRFNEASNNKQPESNCGVKIIKKRKILVAYASRWGTTGEVAVAVGKVLDQKGNAVDTRRITTVKDLGRYEAVIIGGAIHYDRWMSEATEFVTANQNRLKELPVAFFFTCLTLCRRTQQAELKAKAYAKKLSSLAPQIEPVSIGRFAGVLDYAKLPFFTRLVAKGIFAIIGVPEGDFRDWEAIRSWAKDMHCRLSETRASYSASY